MESQPLDHQGSPQQWNPLSHVLAWSKEREAEKQEEAHCTSQLGLRTYVLRNLMLASSISIHIV